MANVIPSDLKPRIVTDALDVLEETFALLGSVEKNYSSAAGQVGDVVSVGKSQALDAVNVTAAATAPAASDITLDSATITIDQFKKTSFKITGQEFQNYQLTPTFMKQVQQAVRGCVKKANEGLMDLYYKIPYYAGDASRSLFNDGSSQTVDPLADLGKVLRDNNVNGDNWKLFLSPTEEASAKKVSTLQNANNFGTRDLIMDGEIGRVLSFDTFVDQQIPTHTVGTETSATNNGGSAVGDTTIPLTGTFALKQGDLVTFGDGYDYSVQADTSATSMVIDRGLEAIVADTTALAFSSGHGTGEINIAGDMTGFGMVSRLPQAAYFGGGILGDQMVVTHSSGLSMLLGTYSQYHQLSFECALLYGQNVIDSRKLARGLGA